MTTLRMLAKVAFGLALAISNSNMLCASTVSVWSEDFEGASIGATHSGANALITGTSVYAKNYVTDGQAIVEATPVGFTGNASNNVLALYASSNNFEALTPGANGAIINLGQTFSATDVYTFSFDVYLPSDNTNQVLGTAQHRWRNGTVGDNVVEPAGSALTTAGVHNVSFTGTIASVSNQSSIDGIAHFIRIWEDQWDGTGAAPLIGYIDNISLTVTAVPEPNSFAVLALSTACVLARRRNQR